MPHVSFCHLSLVSYDMVLSKGAEWMVRTWKSHTYVFIETQR